MAEYNNPASLFVSILSGMCYGFPMAIVSGVLVEKPWVDYSPFLKGFISSALVAGAAFGCLSGGFFSDKFGPKKVILFCCLIIMICALATALQSSSTVLIIFRIIAGLGVGVISALGPLYVSEQSTPKRRGTFVSLFQTALTFSIVLAYTTNLAFNGMNHGWRIEFAFTSIPPLILFIGGFFIPESSGWRKQQAIKKSQHNSDQGSQQPILSQTESSQQVLQQSPQSAFQPKQQISSSDNLLRPQSLHPTSAVDSEKQQYEQYISPSSEEDSNPTTIDLDKQDVFELLNYNEQQNNESQEMKFSSLKTPPSAIMDESNNRTPLNNEYIPNDIYYSRYRRILKYINRKLRQFGDSVVRLGKGMAQSKRMLVVGLVMTMSHQLTGVNAIILYSPSIIESVGITAIKARLIATIFIGLWNFITTIMSLFLVDSLGRRPLLITGFCLMTLGHLFVVLSTSIKALQDKAYYLSLPGLAVFLLGFELGVGPIFYVLVSEIFPEFVRGRAISLLSALNWSCNILIVLLYLPLVQLMTAKWVYVILMTFSAFAAFFAAFVIPETKGKTLDEITGGHTIDKDNNNEIQNGRYT
ncbi:MAG: sugar porter family MFS transporter [Streblomastix strix]|uniref:Sugar porter family MFS transporter n=1 Tax=Streblomastix strix TaxID=222440 RepID=A0A5J4W7K3_9EUKA|nr:MAG: sugar porter family MFS transporter [Streblomastix strix]